MAEYGDLLIWAVVVSTIMFFASPVLLAIVLVRLPHDYLTSETRRRVPFGWKHPLAVALIMVLKNVLGAALILAGVVMLFTPGQGLLALAMGLALVDFPGKRRWERRLLSRPRVLRGINRVRAKAGRPPLEMPREDDALSSRSVAKSRVSAGSPDATAEKFFG